MKNVLACVCFLLCCADVSAHGRVVVQRQVIRQPLFQRQRVVVRQQVVVPQAVVAPQAVVVQPFVQSYAAPLVVPRAFTAPSCGACGSAAFFLR